jgi:uncharacterized coiled-coil protein SlyX
MAPDDPALAEVVTDLEVRLAFQDRAVQVLDDVVQTLFARVEALEHELREMRKTASSVAELADDPPPHY